MAADDEADSSTPTDSGQHRALFCCEAGGIATRLEDRYRGGRNQLRGQGACVNGGQAALNAGSFVTPRI